MEYFENNGLRLCYTTAGQKDAPAVLFLHGLSGYHATWESAIKALSENFAIWALDFRGHGHSDHAGSGGYTVAGYASDAAAMLERIGRPTLVVGHSLGAAVAAYLATHGNPYVKALFLEDPPLFFQEHGDFKDSPFATIFPIIRDHISQLQANKADLLSYKSFVEMTPAQEGGTAKDHLAPEQLCHTAQGYQLQDVATWNAAIDGSMLQGVESGQPIACPITVVAADAQLGSAFRLEDDERLLSLCPQAQILRYTGVGHRIHANKEAGQRFVADLLAFAKQHA